MKLKLKGDPFEDQKLVYFSMISDFAEFASNNERKYIRLWAYNIHDGLVHKVDARPNSEWGG